MLWSRQLKLQLIIAALLTPALGIATVHAEMRENYIEQPKIVEVGSVDCFQNGIEILSENDRSFDSLWVNGSSEIVRFESDGMITLMASQDGLACILSFERQPTHE